MFVCVLTLAISALSSVVLAQGNISGLLQALDASGLDQFANVTQSLNSTPTGQHVLNQLSQGNNTIFAPTDNALSGAHIADLNATSLADLISYHVVPGNFTGQTPTYPNVTIGRTLLNDSNLVMLPGNQSQVLAWSKYDNGSLFVQNQGSNVTVSNVTNYNNTAIVSVDSVLTPPPNLSTVLDNPSYDLSTFAAILRSTYLVNGSSVLDTLSSSRGITVFAPNNAGIQAASNSLNGITNNATALGNVIYNHVINGSTVYSTEISPQTNLTSAAGQNLAFSGNSTGQFVSVGGSNQVQIVDPNVLTSNGVIHVVNGVMLDTNSDPALASSAYISATSVAAHSATQTGPVASTPTTTHAGAIKDGVNNWRFSMLAGVFAIGFGQLV